MPTYVYRFVDTGETIEVQQSFADPALTEATHPTTGEVLPVRKVFTPVGVTFKGGGFYKTDSRGKKATGGKKDETPSTSKDSTSKESTSKDSASKESTSSGSSPASRTGRGTSTTTTSGSGRD
jgi:predicted nucleic acid-binding Zn ribbon protein